MNGWLENLKKTAEKTDFGNLIRYIGNYPIFGEEVTRRWRDVVARLESLEQIHEDVIARLEALEKRPAHDLTYENAQQHVNEAAESLLRKSVTCRIFFEDDTRSGERVQCRLAKKHSGFHCSKMVGAPESEAVNDGWTTLNEIHSGACFRYQGHLYIAGSHQRDTGTQRQVFGGRRDGEWFGNDIRVREVIAVPVWKGTIEAIEKALELAQADDEISTLNQTAQKVLEALKKEGQ